MPNSNTIINIAPTTDITVSTLTNIFVKINAVTIYFATSKNHFPICLFIFTISKPCCKNAKNK